MLDTTLSRDGTSAKSLKPRTIGFIIANLLFLVQGMVGYGGVLLGLLPQTPTDDFAFFLIVVAYHGPFFAFLDAKGERRSKDEKFQLFVNWWIIVAASAAIFWELPWYYLEDNILRRDIPLNVFHEGLEWLWIFWGYGIADNRFLNGDGTVLSVEFLSIHTSLMLIIAYFMMKKGNIWGYRLAALGMMGVAYGTIIYVFSEWYEGWPLISDRPYDFWVKFILTQTPYIFYGGLASFFCVYLAGQQAIENYKMQRGQT